jgi:hypothetical protein
MPLGSLTGGLLGTVLGLRPTLAIAGAGGMLSVLWALGRPVRTLDAIPDHEPADLEAADHGRGDDAGLLEFAEDAE